MIILNALRALGPVAGDGRNGLPAVSLQRMQDEHRKLEGLLTELSQMARDFASRPAPQAQADNRRLVAALHGLLERHERDDEQRLYPLLSRYMGARIRSRRSAIPIGKCSG